MAEAGLRYFPLGSTRTLAPVSQVKSGMDVARFKVRISPCTQYKTSIIKFGISMMAISPTTASVRAFVASS